MPNQQQGIKTIKIYDKETRRPLQTINVVNGLAGFTTPWRADSENRRILSIEISGDQLTINVGSDREIEP